MLQRRYGMSYPLLDADVRVIITVEPTTYVALDAGMSEKERAVYREKLEKASS